jgi:hypothetical protein
VDTGRSDGERVGLPAIHRASEEEIAMDEPTKTAKQLLDMKKQAGFFSVSASSTVKAALEVLSESPGGGRLSAVQSSEGPSLSAMD